MHGEDGRFLALSLHAERFLWSAGLFPWETPDGPRVDACRLQPLVVVNQSNGVEWVLIPGIFFQMLGMDRFRNSIHWGENVVPLPEGRAFGSRRSSMPTPMAREWRNFPRAQVEAMYGLHDRNVRRA